MLPQRSGQIVKFHTPNEDENPDDRYVVIEIKEDGERSRVDIRLLGDVSKFVPINTVPLSDLEVTKIPTLDLINTSVYIVDNKGQTHKGIVTEVIEDSVDLKLEEIKNGYISNVDLRIVDQSRVSHLGKLIITF